MPDQSQSPLQLFMAGEAELVEKMEALHAAHAQQQAVESTLAGARRATDEARGAVNEYGAALLAQIHGAVTDETDPGEYIQAILNTHNPSERRGDTAVDQLNDMRTQTRGRVLPIGVIGSTMGDVVLGLSAGDFRVRRRRECESGFDTYLGIALSMPLTGISHYSGDFSSKGAWRYKNDQPEPREVRVRQHLSNLRMAGAQGPVTVFNDAEPEPFRHNDTAGHYERHLKSHTGFVPFVAYGQPAVSELLAALYEGRNIALHHKPPEPDDVLAAAIRLGIAPERVTEVDTDALKDRLQEKFLEQISGNVRTAISQEAASRDEPAVSKYSFDWHITASPQVMAYAGVGVEVITDAVQTGIENSIQHLRVDDEADKRNWIATDQVENRLLEDEARELAASLMMERYGLAIDSSQLGSETLANRLAEQLETKRVQKARHDQRARRDRTTV